MSANGVLLALETSGDVCGLALTRDGLLLGECRFRHEMHLSERILGEMDWLLKSSGLMLSDVDAFAVGIGPGSFTGTRIGVMTLKTLASVQQKPIYGIDSLAALAAHYTGLQNIAVVPLLPCRSGTVFAAIYDVSGEMPNVLLAPDAFAVETLCETIAEREPSAVIFCGSGAARYQEELTHLWEGISVSFGIPTEPSPALIARLADFRRISEPSDDVIALSPLYLAPPPITQSKTPIPTGLPPEA